MNKTFVIGDIHNSAKGLQQVIDNAKPTSKDTIIFLGDYFDGWSEAKETFELLMRLKNQCNCIFMQGNHDEMVFKWLDETAWDSDMLMWQRHGGLATFNSFSKWFEEDGNAKQQVYEFLKYLKPYHVDDKERLFVHAGFIHVDGAEAQYNTCKEDLWWTRQLVENVFYGYQEWIDRCYQYHEIYIGHTPTIYLIKDCFTPIKRANLTMMDTAAAFTGCVSMLNIDTNELYQSEISMKLYPDEIGRNRVTYNQILSHDI